jgi:hypothetical protein
MLANENESGHRLSVNDDRKPQSYIDMNELPMAVDATNDALRVISMYTFIALPGDTEAPQ